MTLAWTFAGLLGAFCTLLIANREYMNHRDVKYDRKNAIKMKYRHRRHSRNIKMKKGDNDSDN